MGPANEEFSERTDLFDLKSQELPGLFGFRMYNGPVNRKCTRGSTEYGQGKYVYAGIKTMSSAVFKDYVGKTIIIGITYLQHDGTFLEQKQMAGVVESASEHGILIRLVDGSHFNLPPDPRAFRPAPPGEYRFRSTGEIVVNPDLMTSWTINKPPPSESPAG